MLWLWLDKNGKMCICHPFCWVCVLKWVNSGKTGPHPPVAPRWAPPGTFCSSPTGLALWGGHRHVPPGEAGEHCEDHVLWLKWTGVTTQDALHKKGQRRLFLPRRLRSFRGQGVLKDFYTSVVASAIVYGVVCRTGPGQVEDGQIGPILSRAAPWSVEEVEDRKTVATVSCHPYWRACPTASKTLWTALGVSHKHVWQNGHVTQARV